MDAYLQEIMDDPNKSHVVYINAICVHVTNEEV